MILDRTTLSPARIPLAPGGKSNRWTTEPRRATQPRISARWGVALPVLALAVIAAAPRLAAQNRIVVDQNGGGAHRDLPAAVQAAQPGDVLVVMRGDYSPFDLAKPLDIMAAEQGVRVLAKAGVVGTKIRNIAAGQAVTVAGVVFDSPVDAGGAATFEGQVSILNCPGHVRLTDVQILNGPSAKAALEISNANVAMQRSSAVGSTGGHGVAIQPGSSVQAADCSFEGGIGYCAIPCRTRRDPGVGLQIAGGALRGTRLSILGGDTSSIYLRVGGVGCTVSGQGQVALRESTINGGSDTSSFGTGGTGLRNLTSNPIRLDGCSVAGGIGRIGGPAIQGQVDRAYRGIGGSLVSGALRTGTTTVLECGAAPNTFVAIVASSDLNQLAQPTGIVIAITGAVVSSRGRFTVSFPVPDDPSMHYQQVWLTNVALQQGAPTFAPPLGGPILPK